MVVAITIRRERGAACLLPANGSSLVGTDNRPMAHRFDSELEDGFHPFTRMRDAAVM